MTKPFHTPTIERHADGQWYADGTRIEFGPCSAFWPRCGGSPVLSLAKTVMDGSKRIGRALVVFGAAVTELTVEEASRRPRFNSHPAAVEGVSRRRYRVEFSTGDAAVLAVTEEGSWGAEDADVYTTVTVESGTVPYPTPEQVAAYEKTYPKPVGGPP